MSIFLFIAEETFPITSFANYVNHQSNHNYNQEYSADQWKKDIKSDMVSVLSARKYYVTCP